MVLLPRLITHCCESSAGWFVFNFSRPSGGRRRDWDQVGCYRFYSTPYLLCLNVTCGMADISHSITKDMIEPWTQITCDCWCIGVIRVSFSQLTNKGKFNCGVTVQYVGIVAYLCTLCLMLLVIWGISEVFFHFSVQLPNYKRTWPKKSIKTIGIIHFCTLATFTFNLADAPFNQSENHRYHYLDKMWQTSLHSSKKGSKGGFCSNAIQKDHFGFPRS